MRAQVELAVSERDNAFDEFFKKCKVKLTYKNMRGFMQDLDIHALMLDPLLPEPSDEPRGARSPAIFAKRDLECYWRAKQDRYWGIDVYSSAPTLDMAMDPRYRCTICPSGIHDCCSVSRA